MKKYEKPGVIVERLDGASVVSAACSYKVDAQTQKPLPFDIGVGVSIFLEGTNGCILHPDNEGEAICNETFADNWGNGLFIS